MDLLAALNGRIISKAFQFVVPERHQDHGCLLVLGSEGRGEQILKTDQDNALIVDDLNCWPDRDAHMKRFTETLLRLGYPRCPGNIMVSNPEWVGSVTDWKARVGRWAKQGDDASMMNLAILLDAHPAAGRTELVDQLRRDLFRVCSSNDLILSRFARPLLKFSTPLNWFGALKKPQQGIDIKKGGLFPVVHGVRALALQHRIGETGTFARLERLVEAGHMQPDFAEELGESMALFAELRLKQQLARFEGSNEEGRNNQLLIEALSPLERDLLRESLQVVNEFKKRLTRRFHLEY
jgi:CBS domain-containing protein